MNNLIVRSGKYQTTEIISEYLKGFIESDAVTLENLKHYDASNIDSVIFIASVYSGKSLHRTTGMITNFLKKFSNVNVFLIYCSGSENVPSLKKVFGEEALNMSELCVWGGATMDLEKCSFIDRFLVKNFANVKEDYSRINYDNIDKVIKYI